jgi:carbonic anhydrase/acetyltransferase-like protein (isoleucine patch superfamily)
MPSLGPLVTLDRPAFIHETALIYGKVHIGHGSSVWPHTVMRAEMFDIAIGERTNIQDFVMIHIGANCGTVIGDDCSITHHATLHGCTVKDRCLIGIGATIMDGAEIGANSVVAGHAIVTEGMKFPNNSVIAGVPARQVASRDSSESNCQNARFYHLNAVNYANGVDRLSQDQLRSLFGEMAH